MGKFLKVVALVLVIAFIAYQPAQAAILAQRLGAAVVDIGGGFGDFVTRLTG